MYYVIIVTNIRVMSSFVFEKQEEKKRGQGVPTSKVTFLRQEKRHRLTRQSRSEKKAVFTVFSVG